MKNNKGFISVTVIYAFFLVFLSLMLYIVTNMTVNRNLLNNMKKTIKNDISDTNFARYLINHYDELNIIKLNSTTYSYGIDDNSYRYTGANPNNYLKFANSADIYRVIGVFEGKVKLITTSSWKTLQFNTISTNNYYHRIIGDSIEPSNLYSYLNDANITDSYINYINTKNINNYVEDVTWYIGGIEDTILTTGKNIAISEIGTGKNSGATINAKIGTLYLSDYIYAADASNETTYGKNITNTNNWLFLSNSWFITRNSNTSEITVYSLNSDGTIIRSQPDETKNVRPTFYLKNNTRLLSGSGTSTDPYVIGD